MKKVILLTMFLIGTINMSAQEKPQEQTPQPPSWVSAGTGVLPTVRLGSPEQEKQKEEERRRKAEEEYQKAKQLIAK